MHAIDVLPTLLDVIGVAPPDEINGVAQTPIEGVSFAPTLDDPAAPAHITQYYEMLGSRALYHDGWKAVTFHPLPSVDYGDGRDRALRSTSTSGSCTTSPRISRRSTIWPRRSQRSCRR